MLNKAWDSTFKNILKQLLSQDGISVITETDIHTSNQRIDFVIPNNDPSIKSPFNQARKVIVGEFKSESDKLLDGDLLMLISKTFNYMALSHGYGDKKSDLAPIDMADVSCILFLGGGKKASKLSTLKLPISEIENGLFEIENSLIHILIIEIDNFDLEDNFSALKIFARKKIREKTMKEALLNDNNFITSISYFLYKDELLSLAKAEGKAISKTSLSIRSAIEALGLSRVIEEIGLSRVIEEIGLKALVESLSDEDRDKLRELLNSD